MVAQESHTHNSVCMHSSNFGDATREPQLYVFDVCLAKFGQYHEWMALLDVDEYLVLQSKEAARSLPEFLAGYAGFGGLVANWRVFGMPGPKDKLKGSVLRTHVRCVFLSIFAFGSVESLIGAPLSQGCL